MGWVIKTWRPEKLAERVVEQAREAGREVLQAAEREARRWHRVARRERAVADDELQRLEELGVRLLRDVDRERASVRGGEPAPPVPRAEISAHDLRVPRRPGKRSRLRDSPLAELFRATERRPLVQLESSDRSA
ncbi:MAG: hypothetical protein H0U80_06710 [Solirubrobacterales bacterium]|nr:hypothetical protein [Solirubrobacterales bacterium]